MSILRIVCQALTVRVERLKIERYRGIRELSFAPGARTLILGPNNAGKSTVLEALDLLLSPGLGRPRPAPNELDYYDRGPSHEFLIEATIGDLPPAFVADVRHHLEGWNVDDEEVVPEPEAPSGDEGAIKPVVRVRVRGTEDGDLAFEFAKEESAGARFPPRLRSEIGWVYDGRTRDPYRQLAFYQGSLLERLFGDIDLDPAVRAKGRALARGGSDQY